MSDTEKTWWAALWRGLVDDPEGKHYRRLGIAIWLLLHLILHANRATGRTPLKLRTAARITGIPLRTLERWLALLRREGYVTLEKAGKVDWVVIFRWKPLAGTSKLAGLHRHIRRLPPPEMSRDRRPR